MAENFSFDVVSDFDRQELVNALDQVKREISQRYDLKGTETSVDLEKEHIFIIPLPKKGNIFKNPWKVFLLKAK